MASGTEPGAQPPQRVLIVDDSAVIRRVIQRIVEREPGFEVVGTARDGRMAIERCQSLRPDIVTLDVEMPVLDGLGALPGLLEVDRDLAVIMVSSHTSRGARETIEALLRGALDYVTKPSSSDSPESGLAQFEALLVPKLQAMASRRKASAAPRILNLPSSSAPRLLSLPSPAPATGAPGAPSLRAARAQSLPVSRAPQPRPVDARAELRVLALGSSTGGPAALSQLLQRLPPSFPLPIVIAQHMPETFTRLLAERLSETSPFKVREGASGEILRPGEAWIAPGDFHLTVEASGDHQLRLELNSSAPVNCCRPSVDVLLSSLARAAGRHTLAVILTGMGHDGRDGCGAIRGAGGQVLAQDEASSVIWGMPGAVVAAGFAQGVYPISRMADEIASRVRQARGFAKAGS
jgi:two-component system, chemotaxis family, protein-glutamate methylesterase/glutaminase